MCEQETALEAIKIQPRCGGLSKSMILLAEKQCKDYKKMDQRMTNIEKKVDALDEKVDGMDAKIDQVLLALTKEKSSICGTFKAVLSNKVFIYLLITLICTAFGVSVGEVGTFLWK